nr:transposase [Qipengyuania sphaerica]
MDANFRIDTPRILSIDEVCLPSGKDEKVRLQNIEKFPNGKTKVFRTILSDGETSQVVDVLPDKEGFTVYQALVALQGYERIRFVTIDLSANFRNAVRAAFGDRVTIVADRWHVAKRINSVVDKARRNVRNDQKDTAKDLRLCLATRSRVLKEKNQERHQALMDFLECAPHLKSVYWAKERLLDVYHSRNREEAEAKFSEWREWLDEQQSDAFSGVIQTFSNWRLEIFSYWDCIGAGQKNDAVSGLDPDSPINDFLDTDIDIERYTNARAEARNRQIRHLNGAGRSYSFRFLRARSIFSTYEVWRQFSICFECRTAFRRDMSSLGRRIERAVDAHAAHVKFNPAKFCRGCEPSSSGVTRSDGKPVQPFVTRCGLIDVWTEREPAIKDQAEWFAQSEGRMRRLKLLPEKASASPSLFD